MMSGGTRFLTCLLRTLRKTEDKANTLIAGAFGGLSVVFFSSTELAMYFVGKALESLFYFACEQVFPNSLNYFAYSPGSTEAFGLW